MKTENKNKIRKITINIGENEFQSMKKVIKSGSYLNHSDYIRDLIRVDLRKRKLFLNIKK